MKLSRDAILISLAVLVAVGAIGTAALYASSRSSGPEAGIAPPSLPPEPDLMAPRPIAGADGVPELPIVHEYKNGMHSFTGTVDKPGECFALTHSGKFSGGEVRLAFTMKQVSDEGCAFSIVPEGFHISVEAPEDATIKATFNGGELRLVPEA